MSSTAREQRNGSNMVEEAAAPPRRKGRRNLAAALALTCAVAVMGTLVAPLPAEASGHRQAPTMEYCLWFKFTLRVGTTQTECTATLQDFLNVHKYLNGRSDLINVDGIFGPATKAAVEYYQGWWSIPRLKVDGIVGPITWEYIHATCRSWQLNPDIPDFCRYRRAAY